eukprot:5301018-Pyramimonas_sp.AAC.1
MKIAERAKTWGCMGVGSFHTCEAFRVLIASVGAFVAQLRPPPSAFDLVERRVCAPLFPGPGSWAKPEFMARLRA